MGTRTQFASFSQPRYSSNDTQIHQQDVQCLFETYSPTDDVVDVERVRNVNEDEIARIDTVAATDSLFDSKDLETGTEELFERLEIQAPITQGWTHKGSRFNTPEMHLSRVAPLDYCDDEELLFQVIETLSEKKMRYLIHQVCRDQASAFRWFSRECLDMECKWPLMKLRVGLRQSTADEFEDAWWHNEFWERRTKGYAKKGSVVEGREDIIRSPWIMDSSLPGPCPTCVPQVQEEIEAMQEHGKVCGKGKVSAPSHDEFDIEHETFACHQCGKEITPHNRTEYCVFHPPSG